MTSDSRSCPHCKERISDDARIDGWNGRCPNCGAGIKRVGTPHGDRRKLMMKPDELPPLPSNDEIDQARAVLQRAGRRL